MMIMPINRLFLITFIVISARIHADGPAGLFWPATVQAFYSTDLYGKDVAYVTAVYHDIGDHVEKGELLARLENPELLSRMDQAKYLLAQAEANVRVAHSHFGAAEAELKLKQVSLQRLLHLFSSDATTAQSRDEAQASMNVAEARLDQTKAEENAAMHAVEASQAELARLQKLLNYDEIRAPYRGVITRRWVNPGDLVTAGGGLHSTPLWNIQVQDRLRIVCYVPEKDLYQVHRGDNVLILGPEGLQRMAQISRLGNRINEDNRSMRVEIDVINKRQAYVVGAYVRIVPVLKVSKSSAIGRTAP